MRTFKKFLLLLLLATITPVLAESLSVGDTVPDFTLISPRMMASHAPTCGQCDATVEGHGQTPAKEATPQKLVLTSG